jgi:hypothetical protein
MGGEAEFMYRRREDRKIILGPCLGGADGGNRATRDHSVLEWLEVVVSIRTVLNYVWSLMSSHPSTIDYMYALVVDPRMLCYGCFFFPLHSQQNGPKGTSTSSGCRVSTTVRAGDGKEREKVGSIGNSPWKRTPEKLQKGLCVDIALHRVALQCQGTIKVF